MYYFTFFEIRAQFVKAGRFLPWTRPDIMSLYLIHTVLHTALMYIVISIYANRTMEQGGLEVPITVHCAISTQKAQFLTRLKQLINKRWRDRRDFNDSEHFQQKKESACVSHNNRNVNIAIYFQFCFVVQHPMYIAVNVTPDLFIKHLLK